MISMGNCVYKNCYVVAKNEEGIVSKKEAKYVSIGMSLLTSSGFVTVNDITKHENIMCYYINDNTVFSHNHFAGREYDFELKNSNVIEFLDKNDNPIECEILI